MKSLKKALSVLMAVVTVFSMTGLFAAAAEVMPANASYISGDATGDGIINSSDALAIINHVTNAVPITDIVRRTAADVTGDNKLNSTDALMILNFKVGNITSDDFNRKNYNVQKIANLYYDPYTGHIVDEKGVGVVGYGYDAKSGVFYATGEGWQREVGYTEAYDRTAVLVAMPLDTIRVKFNYGGKQWMVQLWKGFYGFLFSGCEIGFYNRPESTTDELKTYNIVKPDFYQDITVKFTYLFHSFTRSDHCWWLTGFTPTPNISVAQASFTIPLMTMETTVKFNDAGLYKAFISGLKGVDHIFANYTGKTREFKFTEGVNMRELGSNTVTFTWR